MKHDMAWDPVADLFESFEYSRRFLTAAVYSLRQGFKTLSPWLLEARAHPFVFASFSLVAVLLAFSFVAGLGQLAASGHWQQALTGGTAGFVSTAFGASLALGLKKISEKSQDLMLGFAAGMMLAASAFALIVPGLEEGKALTGSGLLGAGLVTAGLGLGVILMLGLDRLTPHSHEQVGACGPGCERLGRVGLFVLAIAIHNIPEGMAIGVGFGQGDLAVGLSLTSAISVQNIPEGLVVALVLRSAGLSTTWAVLIAMATGLMEPLGAVVGFVVANGYAWAYPVGLGLAAGAMLFVVSHEVIPETHRRGHQTTATMGLMAGFATMMILDVALA
ncbi:MAG: ZIP family metal transporter [Burkholderiaceae bacterium]